MARRKRGTYSVHVFENSMDPDWNYWRVESFKTLQAALKFAAKYVRWGYEARIKRSN